MILKKIKPELQVKFNSDDFELKTFYYRINDNLIPIERISASERNSLPTILDEFNEYITAAELFTFKYDIRKILEKSNDGRHFP